MYRVQGLFIQAVRGDSQTQPALCRIRRVCEHDSSDTYLARQYEGKGLLCKNKCVNHYINNPFTIMTNEIERALHELKLPGMASCWNSLEETHQLDKISLRDGMQIMLQNERDTRQNNRIQRLIKQANFCLKASVEELETDTTRGISAASAAELAAGGYIDNGMTVIITGPAGTGKSYFACALGDRACRNGVKVMYFTMNMLIENLKLVHLEGRETNFFRKLNNQDVLIVDDFGMVKLDGQIQHDFEQIIDDRYNKKALILASQLPVADWYNVFQSELIAEACLDRLVHKAIKFDLKGESLRKKY